MDDTLASQSRTDSQGNATSLLPDGLITAIWISLGILLLSLLVLAALVLVRSGFFSAGQLSDEQTKALWAFLGVALGAAVTLLGALLADQNNRRTTALAKESAEREQLARDKQHALAQEAEERLITDTVTRVLELITVEGGYASRARVAGAIATFMQLRGGTIAVRILGELWRDDAVDSSTAVWLIDRMLMQYSPETSGAEVQDAAVLLTLNAAKLVPAASDTDQDWYLWPSVVEGSWPAHLPDFARNALLVASVRVLLARERSYWYNLAGAFPVGTLCAALDDDAFAPQAARVLSALIDSGTFDKLAPAIGSDVNARAKQLAEGAMLASWFERMVDQVGAWSTAPEGDRSRDVQVAGPMPVTVPSTAPDP